MLEQFLNHIVFHRLCKTTDKIVLAVSGGIDSMVMLRLFADAGFKPVVAHCNFKLRGEASDLDEQLVRQECERLGVPFHSIRFDTARIADERRVSVQMAARDLRYEYFQRLRSEIGFDKIATAHNANDNIETVIMNLIRGTGIDGIDGIPVKTGEIIRPLLFASRAAIKSFAVENQVIWRDDASNFEDDYTRNYLRHHVLPHLQTLNPNLESTVFNSLERISVGVELAKAKIAELMKDCIQNDGSRIRINIERLNATGFAAVLLWEFLKSWGFNYQTCRLMVEPHQTGKKFSSADKIITVDRDFLELDDMGVDGFNECSIGNGQTEVASGGKKLELRYARRQDFTLSAVPGLAQIDSQLLKFPLIWRKWQPGDSFVPFGMGSSKKISDFLTDIKIPASRKEEVTVLQSGDDIVWVVGHRISDRYKVTEKTTVVVTIACEPLKT